MLKYVLCKFRYSNKSKMHLDDYEMQGNDRYLVILTEYFQLSWCV